MPNAETSSATATAPSTAANAAANESGALLPTGLRDVLPPEAEQSAAVTELLLGSFARRGYRRVKPPLIEFEDSLLIGAGAGMASETFRLMDPVSQRMMGLRADITLQIARIAVTRLSGEPRPLRIAYVGDVLRVRGKQLRPERQFTQIGAELIGAESAAADAEAILMAVEGLKETGVHRLSVDLSLPPLVPGLIAGLDLPPARISDLREALDKKDLAAVEAAGGDEASQFIVLMQATGAVADALPRLCSADLPASAKAEIERLSAVIDLLRESAPDLPLTIDPVDKRGFEYHHGVSFTIFAPGVRGEMGHGGRYLAGEERNGVNAEPATGFTLYLDTIMRALPEPSAAECVYLPVGTTPAEATQVRDQGWITLAGLGGPEEDAAAEAQRLGCTHLLRGGDIVAL